MDVLNAVNGSIKARPLVARCGLDRIGMLVSATCAVHCAALPILLPLFSGMGWLGDERLEWSIILFAFTVGSIRLFYSYFRQHHRPDSVAMFVVGVASILLAKSDFLEFDYAEPIFMTIGGLMIACAHWRNHRLVHEAGIAHAH